MISDVVQVRPYVDADALALPDPPLRRPEDAEPDAEQPETRPGRTRVAEAATVADSAGRRSHDEVDPLNKENLQA